MLYRGFKKRRRPKLVSDINITPFVDVLLVLLIIFMVAAPMMTSSVVLNLPEGAKNPQPFNQKDALISIKRDGKIFLNDDLVASKDLPKMLQDKYDKSRSVSVRGDEGVKYGNIMDVIKVINEAGFSNIALVTEVES